MNVQGGVIQYDVIDPATGKPAVLRCACGKVADGILESRLVCLDCAAEMGYDVSVALRYENGEWSREDRGDRKGGPA
jgi:hypothetical protein